MKDVLEDIIFLMCNQNAKRGYPNDITKEFINDPKKFEKNAKEWCKKYANMNGGGKFHYYMVFEEEHDEEEKALSVAEVIDLIRQF